MEAISAANRVSHARRADRSGVTMRVAGATKNVLAAVMNASAVAIFVFSPKSNGSLRQFTVQARSWEASSAPHVRKVNERVLRLLVVLIGLTLTVGLFVRGG